MAWGLTGNSRHLSTEKIWSRRPSSVFHGVRLIESEATDMGPGGLAGHTTMGCLTIQVNIRTLLGAYSGPFKVEPGSRPPNFGNSLVAHRGFPNCWLLFGGELPGTACGALL